MIDELFAQTGLSLERLRAFCLVAEAGGLTKAASGNASKQPLLSRQIKELEVYFGVELLRRAGSGITLTVAGKRLHRLARNYFGALGDFKNECSSLPVHLNVGAGESVIQWLILPRLEAVRRDLPGSRLTLLNLSTQAIAERLAVGEIELGVLRKDAISSRMKCLPLGTLQFAMFVPRERLPKARGWDWELALSQCPLAVLEGAGSFRTELKRSAEEAGIKLHVEVECSSFPMVARALREARIAAILPVLAQQEFPSADFELIALPWASKLARDMVLGWNPRVANVRDTINQAAGILGKIWAFSGKGGGEDS